MKEIGCRPNEEKTGGQYVFTYTVNYCEANALYRAVKMQIEEEERRLKSILRYDSDTLQDLQGMKAVLEDSVFGLLFPAGMEKRGLK